MGWTSINPRKNKEFISNMPWVLTHQIEGESSQDPWCTPSLASTKWDCRGLCCAWVLWFPFHGRPMPRGQQPALKPVPKVGPARSWNPRLPKGPFCFLMVFYENQRHFGLFWGWNMLLETIATWQENYLRDMGLRHFDSVLILGRMCSAGLEICQRLAIWYDIMIYDDLCT